MRGIGKLFIITGLVCSMIAAPPPVSHAQDDVSWLLAQINDLRAGLGLHLYTLNPQLSAAATQHSQYMVDTCDVSHTEANGSTPTSRARANGYTGDWISENIYMGGSARAADAWNFWLNSGIHYQGMTHGIVNEIGIGVAYGSCGQGFTLLFGHRSEVNAPLPADTGSSNPPPPPATRYIPPPPTSTRTPTPTVPTLTPSHTWTITPTLTPSPTPTLTPPASATRTSTPLILPIVPALDDLASPTAAVVAQVPTATPTPLLTPTATRAPAAPDDVPGDDAREDGPRRTLLLVLLLGSAVLLGGTGLLMLWRVRRV